MTYQLNRRSMTQAVFAAIAAVSFGAAAVAQDAPQEFSIGVFTFSSGPAAAYGLPGRQGAELMIDMINDTGGIGGVPVRATYVDEAQGAEGVISEYRRIAEDPATQVMIAALSSSNCLALAPVAEQIGMPTVSWNCDTHQLFLGEDFDYTFRPNGNTIPEFAAFAAYLMEVNPDARRIAIINPDYAFGHDAGAIVKATLEAIAPDVEVVAELYPRLGSATFQTEISRLSAARPDAIFSNLWGADLENFVRQAQPRGLFDQSQMILALGETVLESLDLPDGVIVGVLGDGWWNSPTARANEMTVAFTEAYRERFGEYPVFPAMKMANALLFMQQSVEDAIAEADGAWPDRDAIAAAMEGRTFDSLTGTAVLRADNDAVVDQVVGMSMRDEDLGFSVMSNLVRYPGDALMPPIGEDPIAWLGSLSSEWHGSLPKPGSYQ